MTEQEQIDEIAKIVDEMYNVYTTTADDIAEGLYNAGYRKLDDHAIMVLRKAKGIENRIRKETAEKFAKLIEFHSISKRDESGYETFTISNLCMREILREEFGFTNEELETM